MISRLLLAVIVSALFASSGCDRNSEPGGSREAERTGTAIRISSPDGTAAEPAVARNSDGSVLVVFVEHSGDAADVFLQKTDAAGKAIGEKVRVDPNPGEAKAWRGDPPTVAVAPDKTIYVGWTRKYSDPNAKGNDLMISASHDGGQTFGDPVKVNDDAKPTSHGMHSLAIDAKGRIYAAWLDERNVTKPPHVMNMDGGEMHHDEAEPNSEVFYSYSSDGGKTFAANKKISSDVCPCCKTSLLAASDGTIYASWRQVLKGDHRHIAVARSSDEGATFSNGVIVSDDNWQINACPVSGAALASSAPDTIDVLWYTAGAAGQTGLYFTRSSDGGRTFGDRILVSAEAAAGTPSIVEGDGKTTAVFPGRDGDVLTASWSGTPASSLTISKTPDALVPTAADGVTAIVRGGEGKNSVWLLPG